MYAPSAYTQGCGLYPMMGRLAPPEGSGDDARRTMIQTRKGERARVHPCSINLGLRVKSRFGERAPCYLMAYDEITRGDGFLYLRCAFCGCFCTLQAHAPSECPRQSTRVDPIALLLICAHMVILPDRPDPGPRGEAPAPAEEPSVDTDAPFALLLVDDWLQFRVPMPAVAPIATLRLRLAAAFAAKVEHPTKPLATQLHFAVQTMQTLFRAQHGSDDVQHTAAAQHGRGRSVAAPARGGPSHAGGHAGGHGRRPVAHPPPYPPPAVVQAGVPHGAREKGGRRGRRRNEAATSGDH